MDSVTILGPVAASPTSIPFFLPTVPAGFPSPAQDHLEQRVSLDELFGLQRPQIYLCQVGGHSLKGLGILDSDLVLVDKALPARRNDVVVACINGEQLLKIYDTDKHQVVLRSANPDYPPRYVMEAEELYIWGVYVGLARVGRNSG
ncbi:LexA family transcriptional regulator [Pseudomonas sp. ML96]|uniref:LexA family protein n=1 Tax=Pseudomonas sp. ML96 TaxID=1523503 RepID=UPI0005BBD431|nr:S24 family peptidase [Pseudomonas sp. ML96]